MDFSQLEAYLTQLPGQILDDAAQVVAETATEYYKETFAKKAWDGKPWVPAAAPRSNGSLLIDSGNLLNSIRPAYVGRDKVTISAGNEKVVYAEVHNEGYTGPVTVKAHTRRTKKWGAVNVREHTKQANIPQRQFLGKSDELAEQIHNRLNGLINSLK